jgi:polar amino acid transport system substrate-binding protein
MLRSHRLIALALVVAALAMLAACGSDDDDDGGGGGATEAAGAEQADACAKDQLAVKNPGQLTVGTDKPAFPPYFVDDDPTNG